MTGWAKLFIQFLKFDGFSIMTFIYCIGWLYALVLVICILHDHYLTILSQEIKIIINIKGRTCDEVHWNLSRVKWAGRKYAINNYMSSYLCLCTAFIAVNTVLYTAIENETKVVLFLALCCHNMNTCITFTDIFPHKHNKLAYILTV